MALTRSLKTTAPLIKEIRETPLHYCGYARHPRDTKLNRDGALGRRRFHRGGGGSGVRLPSGAAPALEQTTCSVTQTLSRFNPAMTCCMRSNSILLQTAEAPAATSAALPAHARRLTASIVHRLYRHPHREDGREHSGDLRRLHFDLRHPASRLQLVSFRLRDVVCLKGASVMLPSRRAGNLVTGWPFSATVCAPKASCGRLNSASVPS